MRNKAQFIVSCAVFLASVQAPMAASAANPAATAALEVSVDAGTLAIQFKGRPLLVYAFEYNQFKPYVRELYTFRGDNVLRDAPADHLHHHALMYAIRVNDVNFWEEAHQSGRQIGATPACSRCSIHSPTCPSRRISKNPRSNMPAATSSTSE